MTKKHFIALAKVLAHYQDKIESDVFDALVGDVCKVCRETNSSFDDARFIAACKKG